MFKNLLIIILILIIIGLLLVPVQTKTLFKTTGKAIANLGENLVKKTLSIAEDKIKENFNKTENEQST